MEELKDGCRREKLIARGDTLLSVTLHPTAFPHDKYMEVRQKQVIVNKLFHNAAQDRRILGVECTDAMFGILRSIILKRAKPNPIQFLFIRTDYLLDESYVMKQVEINTSSCSFLVYGPKLNRLHSKHHNAVVSESDVVFISTVKRLKELFGQTYHVEDCISLLVDERNDKEAANYFEKVELIRMLEREDIEMVYVTMDSIASEAQFESGTMFYKGRVVFFVYYRWFYNASHYTERDIEMREKIEFSSAISLPSAELQLVGLKIFQLVFKDKRILERYLSPGEIEAIYCHFGDFKEAGEYEDGDEEKYLLKPLGEGGNNIITQGFSKYVHSNEHFLMRKIISPVFMNSSTVDGKRMRVICELGVFGHLVSLRGEEILNGAAGYILRSKAEGKIECGVSCGQGSLDSLGM